MPPKGIFLRPRNEPEKGKWFFPSVQEMAEWSGSQTVWVEETMSEWEECLDRIEWGI